MARFFNLLRGFRRSKSRLDAALSPQQPFVAIGDVHGRDDLLAQLINQIEAQAPTLPIVCVGDYIDRGADSSLVLTRLRRMSNTDPEKLFCLKGNHEAMFLEFIDMPVEAGPRWLSNGGNATLESFGIPAPANMSDPEVVLATRDALVQAVGAPLIDWVRALPLVWQCGNVMVTHAGGDPSRPIEPRRNHGLLWGHPDFLKKQRRDGTWVVHGHFITPEAQMVAGRISLDTGAYATGKLSAAIITPGAVRFLTT